MSNNIKWVRFDWLMERWGINTLKLIELTRSGNLPAFDSHLPKDNEYFEFKHGEHTDSRLTQMGVFKMDDVERIENENPDFLQKHPSKMTAEESREYGQLKIEKIKWDKSINAAVHATIFCIDQEKPVTRKQLRNHLSEKKLEDIPDTTFEKIWKAIPQEYRSAGGRPPKA
jgi:hypothetical protein